MMVIAHFVDYQNVLMQLIARRVEIAALTSLTEIVHVTNQTID